MDTLFSNTAQRSRPHSHDRWTTLYQQTDSFKTFGIAVEPPYVSMDEIPDLAELNTEENVIAKQELLKFCNNLLRSRHQALYEHIEHLDKVTADQILAEVRNIHYQFLKQAIENIEQIKKEFEENAAYEALRDSLVKSFAPYIAFEYARIVPCTDAANFALHVSSATISNIFALIKSSFFLGTYIAPVCEFHRQP